MRILGIDPGNTQSAWCEIANGVPVRWAKEPNAALIAKLRALEPLGVELVAIEMIASYGMAVGKEVFDTCLVIGRLIEVCAYRGVEHRLIYRRDVKLTHCETSRANDANIRAALIDRYGPGRENAVGIKRKPGPLYGLKGDEWSALAIALTAEAALQPGATFMQPRSNADPQQLVVNGESVPF